MFIDQATVRVKAGDGGNGCIAFRREKFVPKGGPSGGDGGSGGSVWIVASKRLNTLYHLQFQREWKAGRGQHGMGSNCSGHDGDDVTIELPVGSVVRDKQTNDVIADLANDGERVLVAKGGRGGWGNQHFATATRQAPRFAQDGSPGEVRELFIELKLIADVGLVGHFVADDGADRELDGDVFAVVARAVRAHAVLTATAFPLALKLQVVEGVVAFGPDDPHGSAGAAVAARGAAFRHELLAAEGDTTMAAITGLYADRRLIDEHHQKNRDL